MKKAWVLVMVVLTGCSSMKMVSDWKNPDTVLFDAYKVLVVGMTEDEKVRTDFETKMKQKLEANGIESFRSIDLFDVAFTTSERSEEEISEAEQQLLNKGFDAILFTKVLGYEHKKTFAQKLDEWADIYGTFREDYVDNQSVYYEDSHHEPYMVYHLETSLYCICLDKERELIWRATIDVNEPKNMEKTMEDYIEKIVQAMEKQDVLFRKPLNDQITGL